VKNDTRSAALLAAGSKNDRLSAEFNQSSRAGQILWVLAENHVSQVVFRHLRGGA
jgi:hypothetical protein